MFISELNIFLLEEKSYLRQQIAFIQLQILKKRFIPKIRQNKHAFSPKKAV
jgi:hypothetical protein